MAALKAKNVLALEPEKQKEAEINLRKRKAQAQSNDRGVIYLGHIPDGFYEDEMRGYFSQFGDVTRVKLSRSKKTGRSRGYAFIEFADDEVAKIVADAMNNYMMFQRVLKCEYVTADKVHPSTFRGSNRPFRKSPAPFVTKLQNNKAKTDKSIQKNLKSREELLKKKAEKLKQLGVEYDLNAFIEKCKTTKEANAVAAKKLRTDQTPSSAPAKTPAAVESSPESSPVVKKKSKGGKQKGAQLVVKGAGTKKKVAKKKGKVT